MSLETLSVLVLGFASVMVLYNQYKGGITTNKILVALVIFLFLFPAILYLLPEKESQDPDKILIFSYSLENTLAYAFVIVLFWALSTLTDANVFSVLGALVISLVLIWSTWDPQWRPLQPVIRAFFVLLAMIVSIFALIRRQKNGIWMVLALMCLAFALKPQLFGSMASYFEAHNFLKAVAILLIGRALSEGNRPLFGRRVR